MKFNIQIKLLLITILLFSTAITIHSYITDTNILEIDTSNLNTNLNKQERLVHKVFTDTILLKTFSNTERYPLQLKDISNTYKKQNIYLYIYKNNKPIFWSTNIYVHPTPLNTRAETSFLKTENISFVAKQKTIANGIHILALIPIEQTSFHQSNYGSKYLFKYLNADNLELANFKDDKNIRNIYSSNEEFLFSVKLNDGPYSNSLIDLYLIFYFLSICCFILLITNFCLRLAKAKKVILSLALLTAVLSALQIIVFKTQWIITNEKYIIFSNNKHELNYFTPNIWAYLFNAINSLWLVLYLVYIKKYIRIPQFIKKTNVAILVSYILISLLYVAFSYVFDQLSTLISHSTTFKKELSQFLYSDEFTLIHIGIYAISIISLLFFTDFILYLVKRLRLANIITINIHLIILIQFIIFNALYGDFTINTILIGLVIIIRPFNRYTSVKNYKYIHIFTLVLLALITNIKFSEASKLALQEQMKATIAMIQSEDDIQLINNLIQIEKELEKDKHLQVLFKLAHNQNSEIIINEYIKKKYFSGYISKYDFKGYYFRDNLPLGEYDTKVIDFYKNKILAQSLKVDRTNFFYKPQVTGIGIYEYFTIQRIPFSGQGEATIILNFTNRNSNEFITNLTGSKSFLTNSQLTGKGSYAIYKNNHLVLQKGNYIYPNVDLKLPNKTNEYVTFESKKGYFHVMLKNDKKETIIVSKQDQPYWQFLAVTSIIFLLLYLLNSITKLTFSIIQSYLNRDFKFRYLHLQIKIIINNIRYSTRIQTLVISSVFIAILISGIITYFSILIQTKETRENNRIKLISEVANKLELKVLTNTTENQIDYLNKIMEGLTDIVVTDFNLFDKNGKLFYTTQPKLYEKKLLAPYLSTEAFIEMNVLKKTELNNEVEIADLKFESCYAQIKNNDYNTIAYLAIPSYNSTEINEENRQILLNTIFNIYTIIIIIFIFLSVYISNKITEPLQIIRKKLSTTNLSDKQIDPLYWERNDEIGLLVKDYNFMIIKLEENAKQLRNAEREIAWREMAKQVAHEIKNPLTPMKLGIQQLNRSFNENDPKLKERFQRTANSFIEQIDALANIANEFSVFAKLPDTNIIVLDIITEINHSIEIFQHSNNTSIEFVNNTDHHELLVLADRDQLLRSFNNLIKNAVEATPSNKSENLIKISIEKIKKNWIRILIEDKGEGVAKDIQHNLFKPNFTTKSSGMGLGLAFVKQTVESMGGKIYFETHHNIGTIFYIEVPLYRKNSELQ